MSELKQIQERHDVYQHWIDDGTEPSHAEVMQRDCGWLIDRVKELKARETELVILVETIRNNLHPKTEKQEAQLEKVRGLKPFPVPLTPNGEQAIWYSELQQALEKDDGNSTQL